MKKPSIWPAYLVMLCVIFLDQLSKYLVRINLEMHHSVPVLAKYFGDTFLFTHVRNSGAAFSLGFSSDFVNRIFFISTTLLALVLILYLLYQSTHRLQVYSLGLVLGGALGNLLDRIILGGVTDFINVDFPDFIMERFPIFNIADSCIFIAVCLLIFDILFIKNHEEPEDADIEIALPHTDSKEI